MEFLFCFFVKPETNCSPRLLHFGVCLFVTNSTPPSSFQLSRFVTYTYFSLFEIFLFLNFLCCNQTWWRSFFTLLGSRVSTEPFNKCVWLKSSILLHMCFRNRSKAPLHDHFVSVKGFLFVASHVIPVVLETRKLSRNRSTTKNRRNN